jgi:AcrR family transcriptional regulator
VALNKKSASPRRAREIARTRQDIVEAAARVFGDCGYHDATMQAIAREAGFTAASLYTYFRSKDEIYEALLTEMRSALLATFDVPVPAGLTFAQQLELLLHRQLSVIAERRDALRVAFEHRPRKASQDEGPVHLLRQLTAFFAEVDEGHLRCAPDEAARILFGLTQAMLLPWIVGADDAAEIPRQASRIVDVFLHGMAHPSR